MNPCVDARACGLDAVFDTMLGVQGGRPCDLQKVDEELVILVS